MAAGEPLRRFAAPPLSGEANPPALPATSPFRGGKVLAPLQGGLAAVRLTGGSDPSAALGGGQSRPHGFAVPPPFTQARLWGA